MDKLKKRLESLIKDKKHRRILAAVLLAAVALIGLSSLTGTPRQTAKADNNVGLQYEQMLEARLCELVEDIEGVGNATVMVTLASGTQYLYASEVSSSSERGNGERMTYEDNIILVKIDGKETPVVVTEYTPLIAGVAVICDGGENAVVRERVINAIRTVLNVPSSDIYVTKKG